MAEGKGPQRFKLKKSAPRALPLLWGSSQLPSKSERKAAGTSSKETLPKTTAQKQQPVRNSKGADFKHQDLTVPHQQQVLNPAGNKMMLSTPSRLVWPKTAVFSWNPRSCAGREEGHAQPAQTQWKLFTPLPGTGMAVIKTSLCVLLLLPSLSTAVFQKPCVTSGASVWSRDLTGVTAHTSHIFSTEWKCLKRCFPSREPLPQLWCTRGDPFPVLCTIQMCFPKLHGRDTALGCR